MHHLATHPYETHHPETNRRLHKRHLKGLRVSPAGSSAGYKLCTQVTHMNVLHELKEKNHFLTNLVQIKTNKKNIIRKNK